jgi:hypothetical protein
LNRLEYGKNNMNLKKNEKLGLSYKYDNPTEVGKWKVFLDFIMPLLIAAPNLVNIQDNQKLFQKKKFNDP